MQYNFGLYYKASHSLLIYNLFASIQFLTIYDDYKYVDGAKTKWHLLVEIYILFFEIKLLRWFWYYILEHN